MDMTPELLARARPSDLERMVVTRYHAGETLAAIGRELGVSRQRVFQIKRRAERRLANLARYTPQEAA